MSSIERLTEESFGSPDWHRRIAREYQLMAALPGIHPDKHQIYLNMGLMHMIRAGVDIRPTSE